MKKVLKGGFNFLVYEVIDIYAKKRKVYVLLDNTVNDYSINQIIFPGIMFNSSPVTPKVIENL